MSFPDFLFLWSGFWDVCKYGSRYGCGMLIIFIHLPFETLRSRCLLAPQQERTRKWKERIFRFTPIEQNQIEKKPQNRMEFNWMEYFWEFSYCWYFYTLAFLYNGLTVCTMSRDMNVANRNPLNEHLYEHLRYDWINILCILSL